MAHVSPTILSPRICHRGRSTDSLPQNLPTSVVAARLLALGDDTPDSVVTAEATLACDHLYEREWSVLEGNGSIEALCSTADLLLDALKTLNRRGFKGARWVAQRVAGLDPDYMRSGSGLFDEIAELDESNCMGTGPTVMQRFSTRYDVAWRGARRKSGTIHLRFVKSAHAMMSLVVKGVLGDSTYRLATSDTSLCQPEQSSALHRLDATPGPPGRLVAASPHPTNAPPHSLVAPRSVGELVAA